MCVEGGACLCGCDYKFKRLERRRRVCTSTFVFIQAAVVLMVCSVAASPCDRPSHASHGVSPLPFRRSRTIYPATPHTNTVISIETFYLSVVLVKVE